MVKKVDKLIEAEKFLAGLNPEQRADFEREIKSYNIAMTTEVRGCGSHGQRCLWDVCGRPMIQWVLEAAKGSRYINKIAIVTEDRQIRDTVEGLGILVIPRASYTAKDYPRDYRTGFHRRKKPRSLLHLPAEDHHSMPIYAQWHLENMESYYIDVRVALGANWPMVTTELIDNMIEVAFAVPQVAGVTAYCFCTDAWFFINYEKSNVFPIFGEPFDRQEKFPICRSGGVSVQLAPSQLNSQGGIVVPYPVSEEIALDVHTKEDLFKAQCWMRRRLEKEKINEKGGKAETKEKEQY